MLRFAFARSFQKSLKNLHYAYPLDATIFLKSVWPDDRICHSGLAPVEKPIFTTENLDSGGAKWISINLHLQEKVAIQRQLDAFMLAIDVRQIPAGYGLKKFGDQLWEFRADLALRVLFHWDKNEITFLFVGNHNEVQRFCKYYR